MKALVQRVSEASVTVDGKVIGQIDSGLLILLGISPEDDQKDEAWLLNKVLNMRIFNDQKGVMNLSVLDVGGEILVISQFTLMANTKKGHRPSYIGAAKPEQAKQLYERFVQELEIEMKKKVSVGEFGADMKVHLINDGPVTILLDSKNK